MAQCDIQGGRRLSLPQGPETGLHAHEGPEAVSRDGWSAGGVRAALQPVGNPLVGVSRFVVKLGGPQPDRPERSVLHLGALTKALSDASLPCGPLAFSFRPLGRKPKR